jgi:hypothetical protein
MKKDMDNSDSNFLDPDSRQIRDEVTGSLCGSYAQEVLERAAQRRREIARDYADDERHLEAATELSHLATEVRALAGSPLEATFENGFVLR